MSKLSTATRGKLQRALKELESFTNSYWLNSVTGREMAHIHMAISEIQIVEARMYRDEQDRAGTL